MDSALQFKCTMGNIDTQKERLHMKTTIMLLAALSLISLPVFADEPSAPAQPAAPAAAPAPKAGCPCKQIEKACEAAGFVKGKNAPAGKNVFKDCLKPIKEGKTVEGVTVDPATVQGCQACKGGKGHHGHNGMSHGKHAYKEKPAENSNQ